MTEPQIETEITGVVAYVRCGERLFLFRDEDQARAYIREHQYPHDWNSAAMVARVSIVSPPDRPPTG